VLVFVQVRLIAVIVDLYDRDHLTVLDLRFVCSTPVEVASKTIFLSIADHTSIIAQGRRDGINNISVMITLTLARIER
jgi:hypothetical protein